LVARLRNFGYTSEQIRRALFLFANMKGINHPLDKDKTLAGKDCFSGHVKINGNMALRNLEVLSITRTQRLNHKTVDYFYLNRKLCTELNICDKTHLIFIMDETVFPFKNVRPKTVPLKVLHFLLISPVLKRVKK
jgi:hypothetical protein